MKKLDTQEILMVSGAKKSSGLSSIGYEVVNLAVMSISFSAIVGAQTPCYAANKLGANLPCLSTKENAHLATNVAQAVLHPIATVQNIF